MFFNLFVLFNLLNAFKEPQFDGTMEVYARKEFVLDLPKETGFNWVLDEDYRADGLVSYVVDYVDRSRPEFQRFVFQAEKIGYTTLSFQAVPIGEVNPLIFIFPKKYQVHVVEQADIGPLPINQREVAVGDELVIDLVENPSTGYIWSLFDAGYAADGRLSYVSDFRIGAEGSEEIVGKPLIHRFVFRGEKFGYATISFSIARLGKDLPTKYEIHVVEKPDIAPITVNQREVAVGDELVIDLVENPSTGYIWSLFDAGYAADGRLSYVSDFRIEAEGGDDIVGKPLIHRFVFRGEKFGYATISFSIARLGKDLPTKYEIHVVEKPDTGIIPPL